MKKILINIALWFICTVESLVIWVVNAEYSQIINITWFNVDTPNQLIQSFTQKRDDLELYFLSNKWSVSHYTIMDRNMWAQEVYNQNWWKNNIASYWYHYQWWNNYGFESCYKNNCSNFTNNSGFLSTVPRETWSRYIPSKYARNTWSTSANWMAWANKSDWIWWWTWDRISIDWANTTKEWRQWPCPEWYYIPSTLDWKNIYDSWNVANSITSDKWIQWASDLLLPTAGYRVNNKVITDIGIAGDYWSSSPDESNASNARYMVVRNSYIGPQDNRVNRSRWRLVRCLKVFTNPELETFIIQPNSWHSAVIAIDGNKVTSLWTPKRDWFDFEWRYTTPEIQDWTEISLQYVLQTWSTLYAIFSKTVTWTFNTWYWIESISSQTEFCKKYNDELSCTITMPTITIKDWYEKWKWVNSSGTTINPWETTSLTHNDIFTASAVPILYTATFTLNGWISTWNTADEIKYTIESGDIILDNPVKTGYTFVWWTWTNWDTPQLWLIITWWSIWDFVFYAVWIPKNNTPYVVNHYQESLTWLMILVDTDNLSWTTSEYTNVIGKIYDWFSLSGEIQQQEILADGSTIIDLFYRRNEYTITFDTAGWSEVSPITVKYDSIINLPDNPVKPWYRFIWRSPILPTKMPTKDLVVVAQWESAVSWWGWRTKNGDKKIKNTEDIPNSDGNQNEKQNIFHTQSETSEIQKNYSLELQSAYKFAYENKITTMNSIDNADMDWILTRIVMAKMLSQYAINVLWIEPDNTRNNQFADVSAKLDAQYNSGVTLAYQLWIMWINMPKNRFRPNDLVTRAEFATALSRMLYHTSDWEYKQTNKYYVHHFEKLKEENIMTVLDPKMKEVRWYVMLMLKRSAEKK